MKLYKSIQLAFIISTSTFSAMSSELIVSIDHIKNDQGSVLVQLFQGEENYKTNKSQEYAMLTAKTGKGELRFKNLKPGEYVVRMFHDENNNNLMDANAFGMPTEGYGFSNEAVGNMGPPQYKDMVVTIKSGDQVVNTKTKMIYL
jgi:uncharacterized protein (DUF2141 family)